MTNPVRQQVDHMVFSRSLTRTDRQVSCSVWLQRASRTAWRIDDLVLAPLRDNYWMELTTDGLPHARGRTN